MNELKLDSRLSAACEFVRKGSVVADIGTDHGYIPVKLLREGVSPFCYAADINKKPLDKAISNAQIYGVFDKMRFHISDGMRFIDDNKTEVDYPVNDVIICGMGGELIARILEDSPYSRKEGIRLILQPMSLPEKLRAFLYGNGYNIIDEKLCCAAGKVYTVICACYDGTAREIGQIDLLLGKRNIEKKDPLLLEYAEVFLKKLNNQINGLDAGGYDCSKERKLYEEIVLLLKE